MSYRFHPLASRALSAAVGSAFVVFSSPDAWAGNDTYFVTYNHHIEAGEVELMLMNDFTWPASIHREEEGQGNYLSNMLEVEYGLTRQLATEFMLEGYEDLEHRAGNVSGFRWETRYRLFERDVPLNPMLYVEYEDLDPATRFKMEVSGWVRPPYAASVVEPDRERVLETRLVLAQDFGPLDVAFDWISETDLNAEEPTAFGYALGARYNFGGGHGHEDAGGEREEGEEHMEHAAHAGHPAAVEHEAHAGPSPVVGCELYGGIGDSRRIGLRPSRQEHYLQPVMMFHLTHHVMFHAGLAFGLSRASDNLVRTALALEL